MSSYRLLVPCLALICGAQLAASAAEDATQRISRSIPLTGVRHELPLRVPNRLEGDIAQAQAFLANVNARLLTTGVSTSELGAISAWANKLQKTADDLVPSASLWEQQQLAAIARELERASDSINLLAGTVVASAESEAPATPTNEAAMPAPAPVAEPVAPVAEPVAPVAEPVAPVAAPVAPVAEPVAPVAEPVAPVAEPVAPVAEPVAPVAEPVAPVAEPVAPVAEPVAPVAEPVAPAVEPVAPVAEPVAPAVEPVAPADPAPAAPIEIPNQ